MVAAVGSLSSAIEQLFKQSGRGGAPVKERGSIFPDSAESSETMPPQKQGNTNACGTTSLAMIMSYLLGRHRS